MRIEKIVRPYELPNVAPTRFEFAAGLSDTEAPIRIRPGLVGSTRTFQLTNSLQSTVYVIKKPKEQETDEE